TLFTPEHRLIGVSPDEAVIKFHGQTVGKQRILFPETDLEKTILQVVGDLRRDPENDSTFAKLFAGERGASPETGELENYIVRQVRELYKLTVEDIYESFGQVSAEAPKALDIVDAPRTSADGIAIAPMTSEVRITSIPFAPHTHNLDSAGALLQLGT